MKIIISPEQGKVLYSEAGKPLDFVDQMFSYDVEVTVTVNVRNGMLMSERCISYIFRWTKSLKKVKNVDNDLFYF